MAAQVLHFVKCPECEADQMAVAKKVVGKNRVVMLFGHCKDCGKMLQGKGHQDYLKSAESVEQVAAPVAVIPMKKERAGAEDFDPAKHMQAGPEIESLAPDQDKHELPGRKKGSGFLRLLGIVAFLSVGAIGGVAVANKLAGEG